MWFTPELYQTFQYTALSVYHPVWSLDVDGGLCFTAPWSIRTCHFVFPPLSGFAVYGILSPYPVPAVFFSVAEITSYLTRAKKPKGSHIFLLSCSMHFLLATKSDGIHKGSQAVSCFLRFSNRSRSTSINRTVTKPTRTTSCYCFLAFKSVKNLLQDPKEHFSSILSISIKAYSRLIPGRLQSL